MEKRGRKKKRISGKTDRGGEPTERGRKLSIKSEIFMDARVRADRLTVSPKLSC